MKSNKKAKGEKGYLEAQKKATIFRTAVLFGLSLAVFLTGLLSTGHKENLLTVVAVLGCLPASRSAVNMIMVLRYHGINDRDYQEILPHIGGCSALADLVFTSYEKNFEIHHMAFRGNCLIGYTADKSCDTKACAKHLHSMCAQNNLSEVEVRIFGDLSKYLNRLDQLQDMPDYQVEEDSKAPVPKADLVCALMKAISL